MSNQNNASGTSDEEEFVERLEKGSLAYISESGPVYNGPTWAESKAAEIIKRLVAERDEMRRVIGEIYFAAYWHPDRECDEEALWTALRNAAGIQQGQTHTLLGDDRTKSAEKRIAELEAERAHSEAAKGVNTQYAWALFHLGLSDDDDPEEFGRQLSDKIDELEAQNQQAREPKGSANRHESSKDCTRK